MEKPARLTLAAIGLRLADALHELTEELRELRKEHTAVRQQVEHIQKGVSCAAGRPPPVPGGTSVRRAPSPIAALRTRYSALFDAGEFRQAASVYAELLAAEAQGCQCAHGYRHHETEHGGCSVCACTWFVASQLPEDAS